MEDANQSIDLYVADVEHQPPEVTSVFGKPMPVGEKTVIPVARNVQVQGLGQIARTRSAHEVQPGVKLTFPPGLATSGSNGSVRVATPVAVIEISGGKVRIQPLINPLPTALAGMLLGGWNLYWILKTIRERRMRRQPER